MEIIILFIIGILVFVFIQSKTHIDVKSFFQPTLPLDRGLFGVYCFTGKQGSGKTYSLNKFIRTRPKEIKIYSNVTLKDIEYTHLHTLEQLLALRDEKNCYIIYDEVFTLMQKTTRFNDVLMEFLSQMRKQKNIFITTAQEWLELPITYRRFVRIQIECKTRPLGRFGGIMTETYYDTTQIKWSQIDNEYVSPLITNKISKYERRYMETYDTNERIRKLK